MTDGSRWASDKSAQIIAALTVALARETALGLVTQGVFAQWLIDALADAEIANQLALLSGLALTAAWIADALATLTARGLRTRGLAGRDTLRLAGAVGIEGGQTVLVCRAGLVKARIGSAGVLDARLAGGTAFGVAAVFAGHDAARVTAGYGLDDERERLLKCGGVLGAIVAIQWISVGDGKSASIRHLVERLPFRIGGFAKAEHHRVDRRNSSHGGIGRRADCIDGGLDWIGSTAQRIGRSIGHEQQIAWTARIFDHEIFCIVRHRRTGRRAASWIRIVDHCVVDRDAVGIAGRDADCGAHRAVGSRRIVAVSKRKQPIVFVVHPDERFGRDRPLGVRRALRHRDAHRVLRHRCGLIEHDDQVRARLGRRIARYKQRPQRRTTDSPGGDAPIKSKEIGPSHRDSCLRFGP